METAEIKTSSGNPLLDEAALRIAPEMSSPRPEPREGHRRLGLPVGDLQVTQE